MAKRGHATQPGQVKDTQVLRTAQQIVKVATALKPGEGQSQEAFVEACALVAGANDSTRKINRTVRQINVQHLLLAGDKFTTKLRDAFQPGDRMTSEEIQERVLAVYNAQKVLELEARKVLRYPFSQEPESRLTPRRAVEVLKDSWHVKRTTVRAPGEEPVNVYQVEGQHALAQSVFTLLSINNNKLK